MTAMSAKETPRAQDKGLRRVGVTGVVLGMVALITCELPIILAVVGLSGLSAGATAFALPPMVEKAGFALGVIGAVLLISLAVRSLWRRRGKANP